MVQNRFCGSEFKNTQLINLKYNILCLQLRSKLLNNKLEITLLQFLVLNVFLNVLKFVPQNHDMWNGGGALYDYIRNK